MTRFSSRLLGDNIGKGYGESEVTMILDRAIERNRIALLQIAVTIQDQDMAMSPRLQAQYESIMKSLGDVELSIEQAKKEVSSRLIWS